MGPHKEHSHSHHHHHHHEKQAPKAIIQAILITFFFMVVELGGGWIANSLALVSDAAHMLTDIGAMLLSLFAIWITRRPITPSMSFGFHRAEILGALLSGLIIWIVSGFLIYESFLRMHAPPEVNGPIVFWVATIGLGANLSSMWMLSSSKKTNINVRAAYLHILSDSLGNLGTVVAGIVLWTTNWKPIDPIITLIFSGLMLMSSWGLVKEAIGVLMESTPKHVDPLEVKTSLQAIEGVEEVHDLHIWSVSSGLLALSVHLVSDEKSQSVLKTANELLETRFSIIHTTIQVEHPKEFKSDRCYDCVPLEMKTIQ